MVAVFEVPAKPYSFTFTDEGTALVVIDMQHDFCTEGGYASAYGRDVAHTRAVIPAIQRTIRQARDIGLPVIYTREGHRPDLSDCPASKLERSSRAGAPIGSEGPLGRHMVRGETGNQLIPEVEVTDGDVVVDKPGKGAFYATDLELILRNLGVTHLVVCGVTTNVCVHSTVREANDRGFRPLTLSDACAAYDTRLHEAAIDTIVTGGGLFGWVATTQDFTDVT